MEQTEKKHEYYVARYSLIKDNQLTFEDFWSEKTKEEKFIEWLNSFTKEHRKEIDYRKTNYVIYCKQLQELESRYYMMTFAKEKQLIRGKKADTGIETEKLDDYKDCHIFIDVKRQFFLIERNGELGNNIVQQKNVIANVITRIFEKRLLYFELELLTEKNNFWEYIRENNGKISEIEFQLVTPNFLGIKTVREMLQKLNIYNNTRCQFKLQNDEGKLTIGENDEFINDAVKYTSNGGGRWRIKALEHTETTSEDTPTSYDLSDNVSNLNDTALEEIKTVFEILNRKDEGNHIGE